MDFEKEKREFLNKIDKSKKGSIDNDILNLIKKINSLKDYFTTSSCSGRIILMDSQKKSIGACLFKSHKPVKRLDIAQDCWFLQEPVIIHIRCKDLKAAKKMLAIAVSSGFKKSGIISLNKIILEIKSSEKMETFLTRNIDKNYLNVLIKKANEKLLKSKEKIKILEKKIK